MRPVTSAQDRNERSQGRPAITVRGLVKRYKEVEAVRGIDLDVVPGETFGFLGPNGAGKSTTIKVLCTLVEATSGTAEVAASTWPPSAMRCAAT